MSTDDYLAFLAAHQPMPRDADITDDEGTTFIAALKHFEMHPDARCIPLLINSVSQDTGLGMYEHITFALLAHPRDAVLPHLERGLRSDQLGVIYRCCWWSTDFHAWEFAPLVRACVVTSSDEDIREAAKAFLELAEQSGPKPR